ncbi:MAG: alpha/beta fold hydrolase [Congregibacter sp.]
MRNNPCWKLARLLPALPLLAGLITTSSISAHAAEIESPPSLTLKELRAKHALPNSRYMDVDGANLHYVDEGSGPVVVLLHASYHSLRTWDALAARLTENYRVVRFDFPTAGLSQDNKPVPPEKFSMMDRYVDTVSGVVDALGIERFTLLGTSSGGAVAFRYASRNQDKLERLVLLNTAGMPRIPRNNPLRERPAVSKWQGMKVRPREFWAFSLAENFIAPNKAPDWLIDQAYDFSRVEGRADRARDYKYSTGDPQAILGLVTAPTLIMWGKNNPTVMHLEADVVQHWLTGAPSTIRKYAGLGHYPYVEDLDAIYPALSTFIAGDLDKDLRRTTMLSAEVTCDCDSN